MSIRAIALCAVALFAFVSAADAKTRHHHHRHHHVSRAHHSRQHVAVRQQPLIVCDRFGCHNAYGSQDTVVERTVRQVRRTYRYVEETIVAHPAGCPRTAFCGCGTSVHIFGHPVRDLYLAANWRRFPSASPGPGMVAWRWGHVFAIERDNGDGTVLAYDPNSGGHQTRVHTVSLHGFHVVDPHGNRVAAR